MCSMTFTTIPDSDPDHDNKTRPDVAAPPDLEGTERICSYNRILYPMYPPSVGEAIRMGETRGGGRLPIESGGKWSDEKKRK